MLCGAEKDAIGIRWWQAAMQSCRKYGEMAGSNHLVMIFLDFLIPNRFVLSRLIRIFAAN